MFSRDIKAQTWQNQASSSDWWLRGGGFRLDGNLWKVTQFGNFHWSSIQSYLFEGSTIVYLGVWTYPQVYVLCHFGVRVRASILWVRVRIIWYQSQTCEFGWVFFKLIRVCLLLLLKKSVHGRWFCWSCPYLFLFVGAI